MRNPRVDDVVGDTVVAERFDEDLPPARELPTEDAVGPMGLAERSSAVADRAAEVLGSVLIFESLDSIPAGALEHEADHHVVEATVDEVVHDGAQLWLSA
jgi:hypothetical protein